MGSRTSARGLAVALVGVLVVLGGAGVVAGTAGQATQDATAPDCATVSHGGEGTEQAPYRVGTVDELQCLSADLNASYLLTGDIDASGTAAWNGGAGFRPVGDASAGQAFAGTLDGAGHVVANLTIDRPARNNTGLVGYTAERGTVTNVTLQRASVAGSYYVGALVGAGNGTVRDARVTGRVTGVAGTGGVVGLTNGTIADSATAVSVGDSEVTGGLVGFSNGTVSRSYATGHVNGTNAVGGLVGVNGGEVTRSVATGRVEGNDLVGGLVGFTLQTVRRSAATGNVGGNDAVGGLAGANRATVRRTYATGNVTGVIRGSGLVGFNDNGTVSRSYAAGRVDGTLLTGGLVGDDNGTGTATRSYWDTNATGQNASAGGTGLTTAEMTGTLARAQMEFDFSDTWSVQRGDYPELQGLPRPVDLGEVIEFDDTRDDGNAEDSGDSQQNGTDAGEDETGDGNGSDSGDGSGPGFGVVGAVAALAVGSLLRRRHASE